MPREECRRQSAGEESLETPLKHSRARRSRPSARSSQERDRIGADNGEEPITENVAAVVRTSTSPPPRFHGDRRPPGFSRTSASPCPSPGARDSRFQLCCWRGHDRCCRHERPGGCWCRPPRSDFRRDGAPQSRRGQGVRNLKRLASSGPARSVTAVMRLLRHPVRLARAGSSG